MKKTKSEPVIPLELYQKSWPEYQKSETLFFLKEQKYLESSLR